MSALWKSVVVGENASLGDAIAKIDASGLQAALVLSEDGRLRGIMTDGNVRRAILTNKGLNTPISEVMNAAPLSVKQGVLAHEMLNIMRRASIHHLPVLDGAGKVVDLITLDELIGVCDRPNWVVLMAGGLGTRLHPLTHDRPKPMLDVGGKPILQSILENFVDQGFKRFFLSVNYKAEIIRNHFMSGDPWGVSIEYLEETDRLGTAGALSLLPNAPERPIVVMNGDVLTRANFGHLLQFHLDHGAAATMAVREYEFQIPYGVVTLDGERISHIVEKPMHRSFVNAGIYVLSPSAVSQIPKNQPYDMPALFQYLLERREATSAYPLREYWLDIGRLEEFERAQREWRVSHD